MKNLYLISVSLLSLLTAFGQGPTVTAWKRNTTSATGYNSLPSNVQIVQYTTTDVYVSSSCIPDYSIGPWFQNPNTPSNQSFVTKFTRNPVQNTGTLTNTPMGNIGMWINGVSIYNQKDGYYWNNSTSTFNSPGTGAWNRNALYYEGISFDNCLGHPGPNGAYHHHVNPPCLYDDAASSVHSPIIGYAFDGFPIYGAYGYTNVNGTGAIKRMASSYVLSSASTRASGPPVNSNYPLGSMCEDYVFTQGAGDLDEHNGRLCNTPEYPNGIYAYFVTIDANLDPVYPFVLGSTYYGTVQTGNTGPSGSHNSIPGSTTIYNPTVSAGIDEVENIEIKCQIMPNPTADYAYIYMDVNSINNVVGNLYNSKGELIQSIPFMQPTLGYTLDLTTVSNGTYFLTLEAGSQKTTHKIVKSK